MSQIAEDIKEADEERIKSLQRELLQVNEANEKLVVEEEKLVLELQESRLQHNLLTDKNQKLTAVQASRNKEVVKQTVAEDKIRKLNMDLEQTIGVLTEENYLLQGTLESIRAALDDLETKHQKNEASAQKACVAIRAFRGHNDPISNFYFVGTQKLLYKGRRYSSSEQAYQHTRALFHEEKQIAKEIMSKEVNPHGMKNLGGRITASKAWNDIKANIMYEILEAKAACSAVFCEALKIEDPQVVFVEAVYVDFWGSGLPYIETCTRSPGKWPGSNMMGRLISKLRGNIQAITCLSPTSKQTATATATASNASHTDMRDEGREKMGASHQSTKEAASKEDQPAEVQPKEQQSTKPSTALQESIHPQPQPVETTLSRPAPQTTANTTPQPSETTTKEPQAEAGIDRMVKRDVLIGDSTIRFIKLTAASKLEKFIMGGARIEHLTERLPHIIGNVAVEKVILAVGANNVAVDSTEVIRAKYCDLLFKTRETNPNAKVYVLGLHKRLDWETLDSRTAQVNDMLSDICQAYGATFVVNYFEDKERKAIARDGLHLTFHGARLVSERIAHHIYDRLPVNRPFVHMGPQQERGSMNHRPYQRQPEMYHNQAALPPCPRLQAPQGGKLQPALNKFAKWCGRNKLSLNAVKTKLMVFGTRHKVKKAKDIMITINNVQLQIVPTYKYLGVTLDSTLSLNYHVKSVSTVISYKANLLAKIRKFLNEKVALKIYKSMSE